MSSQQKLYDSLLARLRDAQAMQQQVSPYEQALGQQFQANHNYLYGNDLKNLPTGYNVNLLPVADERRMAQYGGGQPGSVAAGANPAGAIATQGNIANDQVARNWGGAYQNKFNQIGQTTGGMQNALQNAYTNRNFEAVQNGAQGLYNISNRPKGFNWLSLLPGLAGAAVQGAQFFSHDS